VFQGIHQSDRKVVDALFEQNQDVREAQVGAAQLPPLALYAWGFFKQTVHDLYMLLILSLCLPPSGGDILFLPCPSIRLSVRPSVRLSHFVSAQ